MPLPALLQDRLRLPLIGAPMFIVTGPELLLAQCKAGVAGIMPSLNVREAEALEPRLLAIRRELEAHDARHPNAPSAPFGVNLVAHGSNARLEHDLDVCVRLKVPIVVTSLGPSERIVGRVRDYGGIVLHDVIRPAHARKAAEAGVDGIIAVAAGAGGHGGTMSPFALCREIRQVFDGLIVLGGAISTGADIAAALLAGADLAYAGTRFIATEEANAAPEYKAMVVRGSAEDIVYTRYFSGVRANYLRESIAAAGLDPETLPDESRPVQLSSHEAKKAWRDVWSAGQGIGTIGSVEPVAALVAAMEAEFREALDRAGQLRAQPHAAWQDGE